MQKTLLKRWVQIDITKDKEVPQLLHRDNSPTVTSPW